MVDNKAVLRSVATLVAEIIGLLPPGQRYAAYEFVIDEIAGHLDHLTGRRSEHERGSC